ncbi:MAG: hypothetical protein B7Z80_24785, partial [Rhodospirillales bacterium 20-64-7]
MTVALLGECMIEFSPGPDGRYAAGYGGDTLNTAVYLARLGVKTDYVTALGDDPFSDQMLAGWAEEGVGTRHAIRIAGALPGLYIIRREPGGDRSFHYWRQQAPVRQFFSRPEATPVLASLGQYDWLYLSGITLSLFAPDNLPALFAALDGAIAGGCRIAFDGNYRAKGWPDIAVARAAFNQVLDRTSLALPTLSDEQALFGEPGLPPPETAWADNLVRALFVDEAAADTALLGLLATGVLSDLDGVRQGDNAVANNIQDPQKIRAGMELVIPGWKATSEKNAMGWYLDGRVTAVLGTHTHV